MSRLTSIPPGAVDPLALYTHATMLRVTYPDGQDYSALAGLGAAAGSVVDVGTRGSLVPSAKFFEFPDSRILAIEGTTGPLQFLLQFTGSYQVTQAPWPGYVSAFLSFIALQVWTQFHQYIDTAGPKPVLLIGHSLGACIAQLIAHKINSVYPGNVLGIVTFGSPRCGNTAFAAGSTWPHLRVVNVGDLVADLPPENLSAIDLIPGTPFRAMEYRHSGVPIMLGINGAISNPLMPNGEEDLPEIGAFSLVESPAVFLASHEIREYARRIRRRCSTSLGAPWYFLDSVNERLNVLQGITWAS